MKENLFYKDSTIEINNSIYLHLFIKENLLNELCRKKNY